MRLASLSQAQQNPRVAWFPTLVGGLVIGLVQTVVAVSLANLVFAGPLRPHLAVGVTMILMTTGITAVVIALFSSSRGVVATTQSSPMVVVAVAVGAVAAPLTGDPALLPTVVTLIVLSTLLTGLVIWLIGQFHLSDLVRYLPYPVIGGFLAGSGVLLLGGAVGVMTDTPFTVGNLGVLFAGGQLLRWGPGLLYGVLLFVVMRRLPHIATFPLLLVGGVLAFYLVLWLSGTPTQAAMAGGFLLGDLGGMTGWPVVPVAALGDVAWGALAGQVGNLGVLLILTPIVLLLNISSIELLDHEDLDLDNELRTVGAANILSAFGGGMLGFHSLSMTTLSHRIQAFSRPVGLMIGAVHLLVWGFGVELLAYTPLMLMGALLAYIGLNFAYDWVVEKRHTLSPVDYGVVLLIAGVVAFVGFLPGIVVGLSATVVTFLITYSRTNIFYRAADGSAISSNVDRPRSHRRNLDNLKRRVVVLELQGFIFFGTAKTILDRVRARLQHDEPPLNYIVIGFRRVTGLDSSALFSFNKLRYLAAAHGVELVLSHLPASLQHEFEREGILTAAGVHVFPDLDRSIEYCEDQLLERFQVTVKHMPLTLANQLAERGFNKDDTKRLKGYMDRIHFRPGDYLIRQDDAENTIFFIEIGRVTILLHGADGAEKRLRTQNMGTVVGEVAFFLKQKRTASVVAELDTFAYRLSESGFERMQAEDPALVIALEALMIRVVAERLTSTNAELLLLVE